MTEVELVLVADNKNAVKGVRELASESQKLYTNNEKQQKRQVGLIADIEKELGKLQTAQKNALTIEHIEKYNKKIAEAKQALDEYNKAGLKAEKQAETMTQSIGKWVAGLGIAVTTLNLLKKAFLETQQGMKLFEQGMAAVNQVLYNVVNGVGNWNKGVAESIILAGKMADLRIKDRIEMLAAKKLMQEYNELYTEGIDATIKSEEKIQKLTLAKEKYIKAIGIEIASTKEQLLIANEQWKNAPTNDKAMKAAYDLAGKILDLQGQADSGVRRLTRQITGEIQRQIEEDTKHYDNTIELIRKAADEEIEINEATKKESERIEKEFTEATKAELEKRRKEKEKLGLDEMQRLEKEYKDKKKLEEDKVKNQIDIEKKYYEWFWEQSEKVDKANKEQADKDQDLKDAKIEGFKELITSANEFTLTLYDRQFSKLENQYNKEADIEEKKYNTSIKAAGKNEKEKARLTEDYNLRRERAEENYNKKRNEINRKAALADKMAALFNIGINTAVGITKALPNLLLVALVAAAGALQAGAVAAKPIPQFAKGGWTGNGFDRDSSGERMAGVVHEKEFVVRRGPAHKFRDVLEAINRDDRRAILNSFNKVIPEVANTILVENNGPNKRLDEVNNNLRKIQSKEEVTITSNSIIYKKGNTIRTIKK